MNADERRILREAFNGLPYCDEHPNAEVHKPARCLTDRALHPVVCKPKPKVALESTIRYGTHTLPREFWTAGPQADRKPGRKAA